MNLEFMPWRRFSVYRDKEVTKKFLEDYAKTGQRELRRQITSGRKSGRMYRNHRASAPGEFPADMTGRLARSIRTRASNYDASFGSTVFYAKYLADGTNRMAKRAMSKEAHENIVNQVRSRMKRWVIWRKE